MASGIPNIFLNTFAVPGPTNYPWRHRKDFSRISFADKNKLLNLIEELVTLTNERDRCILTYDSNDQQELFESLNELTTILNHFCDIETSCKKFDVPDHPWFNKSKFPTLTLNEKSIVERAIIEYVKKNRTECFDDYYYPCIKKECNLLHVYPWIDDIIHVYVQCSKIAS